MIRAARRAGHAAVSAAAGLAAAAVLVTLAAGTPWLMWHVTGWPLPRHLPTVAALRAGVAGQESARFTLALVTCVGWVIWLAFVTQVILEAAWWARQLPGLARGPAGRSSAAWLRERAAAVSPPRALATVLVGGILLGLLAALRGTGTAVTVPAGPRLAAVIQQASAAAPPHPAPARDRVAVPPPRTAAPAADEAAAPAPAPAEAGATTAPGRGITIRLDAVLRPARDQPDSPAYTLYTVRPGDNLWDIAVAHLGDGEKWHQIYALNAGRPQPGGERLVLPSLIQPGWILRLPAPAPTHASGHVPAPPQRPASPAPLPARTPLPGPHPAGRHPPGPVPSTRASQAPGHGITLPWGGLAGAGLAAAVAAALARAGIQRRRRYQPPRITTSALELQPAQPPVIGLLRRAARPPGGPGAVAGGDHCLPAGPDLPAAAHEPRPDPAAAGTCSQAGPARKPAVIPIGLRGGREEGADIAALGGLGLTGPGATAAARAMLLTLLTQAAPGSLAVPAQVIVPAADAAMLIPGYRRGGVTAGSPAGLTVTATLETALDQVEAALLTRVRITGSDGENGDRAGAAAGIAALIAVPGPGTGERLAAILQLGRSAGVTAVLLGSWPHGVTCHVTADGTVTATTPPVSGLEGIRLFHLAADDAEAILSVLDSGGDEEHAEPQPGLAATLGPPAPAGFPQPQDEPPAARPEPASGQPNPAQAARENRPAAAGPQPGPGTEPAAGQDDPPAPAPDGSSGGRIVQVSLLGPPRITAGGREIAGGLRKARELLAFLALHPDGATGEAISEALWPEAPPGHGTSQRNIALRKARALLREATGLAEPMFIILAADRYRLDPGLVSTDITRFRAALETARTAADDSTRLAALHDAAREYRGPLADGAGWEWAEPYAEAARRRALDAWTQIAEILGPRDPDQALAALETAVGHDPYNEFAYQKIMRLQAAAGRLDAVRRTLGLLESRLRDLGITPGPQTRTLAASLLGIPAPQRSDDQQRRQSPGQQPSDRQHEQRTG